MNIELFAAVAVGSCAGQLIAWLFTRRKRRRPCAEDPLQVECPRTFIIEDKGALYEVEIISGRRLP